MELFYYPRVMRRITIGMLDFFDKIQVYNYTSGTSNIPSQIIDVPIKFGPSEKYHLFNIQRESGKPYYAKLPSLLLTLDSMSYNSDRATSNNETRHFYDEAIHFQYLDDFFEDVQPTPYDYNYTLEVKTESIDHLSQILENILPYFNPTNHLRLKEFDFLNIERNLRVSLDSTSLEYPAEMGEEESRYMNAKMTFTVAGYLYRPMSYSKVIKYIKKDYFYDNVNVEQFSTSGLPSSAAPSDFTYKEPFDDNNSLFTKVVV